MSDVTMEQKLQLMQQVRSRYHEDQYDLSNRERILYGRTNVQEPPLRYSRSARAYGESSFQDSRDAFEAPEGENVTSFKLRFWLVLFLVLAVIVMDKNGMEVAGITSGKIFEAISADYQEAIETWAENYSLPSK